MRARLTSRRLSSLLSWCAGTTKVAWGNVDLLAYGCGCDVVVVDTKSVQVVACFTDHLADVTAVSW